MSYITTIPRGGLRAPTEMSGLTSPRERDSIQHMWQTALQSQQAAASARNANGSLSQTPSPRRPSNPSLFYPFKIYQLPWMFRTNPTPQDWLKVRVRTGRCLIGGINNVLGCDGAPDPSNETYNDTPLTYGDIPVPANTASYYIWVNFSTSPAQLYFGTSAASANIPTSSAPWYMAQADTWPTFPTPDATHIPIGQVDSNTYAAQQQLIITQYVRSDIYSSGGGSNNGGSYKAQVTGFTISGSAGDYWNCSNVSVQKPLLLRPSITSRSIYGISANYSYSNDVVRTASATISGNSYSEVQCVIPSFSVGDTIYALPQTVNNVSGNGSNYIDVNADGRAWSRAWDQSL
jgi:hypothetical protein